MTHVTLLFTPICWNFACYTCSFPKQPIHVMFNKLTNPFPYNQKVTKTFARNFKSNPLNHPSKDWLDNVYWKRLACFTHLLEPCTITSLIIGYFFRMGKLCLCLMGKLCYSCSTSCCLNLTIFQSSLVYKPLPHITSCKFFTRA
jgi:hypothetical protein